MTKDNVTSFESLARYGLVGFANSGKSTLFNVLANANQKIGNWSGVTVAAKRAEITLPATNAAEPSTKVLLTDLPGLSSLNEYEEQGQDLTVSQQFLQHKNVDCILNVVDATQLSRQLYLTSQLLDLGIPVIVLLNKIDRKEAISVNVDQLSAELGCPVVEICGQDKKAMSKVAPWLNKVLQDSHITVKESAYTPFQENTQTAIENMTNRHQRIQDIMLKVTKNSPDVFTLSDKIDNVVLHPVLGLPIFFGMMYLLFMFAINVGSAFIDFFDIISGSLFVDYPLHLLAPLNLPLWLLTLIEGIGSGVQTVATFIPIIACLFIGLSLLESSGYLARAAFVVDAIMQKVGLPGKSFVPLIVGFGCTVPAVMATRVLDSERERITTVMMAPFMSCGARLPVYALFAAAFFPDNGQNLVFLLYLIGIAAAIFTGFLLKITILPGNSSLNIMELPLYELPKFTAICRRVWQRTKSFVMGAGKTIVLVVCFLNFFNSIDVDGNFGHQNSETSILSQGAKVVTPLLAPMGVKEDNWQAGVGIITGIFAKEVLVATFNSLYSPAEAEDKAAPDFVASWQEAVGSIKANLFGIQADDPLGMDVGNISDLNVAAEEQEVELSTYIMMQAAFAGKLGAFSYLLFILLYTPCIAAMGAIKSEVGSKWALFAGIWSFTLAYVMATLCFQLGNLGHQPFYAVFCIVISVAALFGVYWWLKSQGRKILTIPISVTYS